MNSKARYQSPGILIVTGDGDFYCMVDYLIKNDKLLKLMVPNKNSFSLLFRKMMPHIVFMNDLRSKLEYDKGTK